MGFTAWDRSLALGSFSAVSQKLDRFTNDKVSRVLDCQGPSNFPIASRGSPGLTSGIRGFGRLSFENEIQGLQWSKCTRSLGVGRFERIGGGNDEFISHFGRK